MLRGRPNFSHLKSYIFPLQQYLLFLSQMQPCFCYTFQEKWKEKSFICKSLLHPMNPQNMYIYFYFILVKFHFIHPSPNLQWSFCLLMPTLIVHVSWLLSLKVRCIIMKFYSLYFLYFIVSCKLCNYCINVYH